MGTDAIAITAFGLSIAAATWYQWYLKKRNHGKPGSNSLSDSSHSNRLPGCPRFEKPKTKPSLCLINTPDVEEVRKELQQTQSEAQSSAENVQKMQVKLTQLQVENVQLKILVDHKKTHNDSLIKDRQAIDEHLLLVSRLQRSDLSAPEDLAEILRYNLTIMEAAAERSQFLLRKITSEQDSLSAILSQSLLKLDGKICDVQRQSAHARQDLIKTDQQKAQALVALSAVTSGKAQRPAVIDEIQTTEQVKRAAPEPRNPASVSSAMHVLSSGCAPTASHHPFELLKMHQEKLSGQGTAQPMHDPESSSNIGLMQEIMSATQDRTNDGYASNLTITADNVPAADLIQWDWPVIPAGEGHQCENPKIDGGTDEYSGVAGHAHKSTFSSDTTFVKLDPAEHSAKIRASPSKKALDVVTSCFRVGKKQPSKRSSESIVPCHPLD